MDRQSTSRRCPQCHRGRIPCNVPSYRNDQGKRLQGTRLAGRRSHGPDQAWCSRLPNRVQCHCFVPLCVLAATTSPLKSSSQYCIHYSLLQVDMALHSGLQGHQLLTINATGGAGNAGWSRPSSCHRLRLSFWRRSQLLPNSLHEFRYDYHRYP